MSESRVSVLEFDASHGKLYSLTAAARKLGIWRGVVYRMAESGELPCVPMGKRKYVTAKTLNELVSRGRGSASSDSPVTAGAQPACGADTDRGRR